VSMPFLTKESTFCDVDRININYFPYRLERQAEVGKTKEERGQFRTR